MLNETWNKLIGGDHRRNKDCMQNSIGSFIQILYIDNFTRSCKIVVMNLKRVSTSNEILIHCDPSIVNSKSHENTDA